VGTGKPVYERLVGQEQDSAVAEDKKEGGHKARPYRGIRL